MSEPYETFNVLKGQFPPEMHDALKKLIYSNPFRENRIKGYDVFRGRILTERQALFQLSWKMAEFLWIFMQENTDEASVRKIDIGQYLASTDQNKIKNADQTLLYNATRRLLFFGIVDSFISSILQIEQGQITGARGLLRFSAEATSRLALICLQPNILADAISKDKFNLRLLPKEAEYVKLQELRDNLSEFATHASISACFIGFHRLEDKEQDNLSFHKIERSFEDIFSTFEGVRDVLFNEVDPGFEASRVNAIRVVS